jgi:hypothetical protein
VAVVMMMMMVVVMPTTAPLPRCDDDEVPFVARSVGRRRAAVVGRWLGFFFSHEQLASRIRR